MKILNFFFRLSKGGFDLLFGQSHQKIIDQSDIALEVVINRCVTSLNWDLQQITLSGVKDRSVDQRLTVSCISRHSGDTIKNNGIASLDLFHKAIPPRAILSSTGEKLFDDRGGGIRKDTIITSTDKWQPIFPFETNPLYTKDLTADFSSEVFILCYD